MGQQKGYRGDHYTFGKTWSTNAGQAPASMPASPVVLQKAPPGPRHQVASRPVAAPAPAPMRPTPTVTHTQAPSPSISAASMKQQPYLGKPAWRGNSNLHRVEAFQTAPRMLTRPTLQPIPRTDGRAPSSDTWRLQMAHTMPLPALGPEAWHPPAPQGPGMVPTRSSSRWGARDSAAMGSVVQEPLLLGRVDTPVGGPQINMWPGPGRCDSREMRMRRMPSVQWRPRASGPPGQGDIVRHSMPDGGHPWHRTAGLVGGSVSPVGRRARIWASAGTYWNTV